MTLKLSLVSSVWLFFDNLREGHSTNGFMRVSSTVFFFFLQELQIISSQRVCPRARESMR